MKWSKEQSFRWEKHPQFWLEAPIHMASLPPSPAFTASRLKTYPQNNRENTTLGGIVEKLVLYPGVNWRTSGSVFYRISIFPGGEFKVSCLQAENAMGWGELYSGGRTPPNTYRCVDILANNWSWFETIRIWLRCIFAAWNGRKYTLAIVVRGISINKRHQAQSLPTLLIYFIDSNLTTNYSSRHSSSTHAEQHSEPAVHQTRWLKNAISQSTHHP